MTNQLASVEFLESNGFSLKPFPDGNYWIRHAHSEMFLQLDESRTSAQFYNNMWVETNLTTHEVEYIIQQFNTKFSNKESDQ